LDIINIQRQVENLYGRLADMKKRILEDYEKSDHIFAFICSNKINYYIRYLYSTIRYRKIWSINPHDNLKSRSTNLLKLKTKLVANS
jgi:CRISPR/Cas system CSM-associated protein Csm2 small subunit